MKVAIVGTGISGVTLALRLQQLGVDDDTVRRAVAGGAARGTDREPGGAVPRHPGPRAACSASPTGTTSRATPSRGIDVDVVGTGLSVPTADSTGPSRAVDFRVYLSRLVEDYVDRGGTRRRRCPARRPDRSSWSEPPATTSSSSPPGDRLRCPQRCSRCGPTARPTPPAAPAAAAACSPGSTQTDPPTVSFNIVPGAGEIFQQPILTGRGVVSSILVEAIPGGPLEPITHVDPPLDPPAHRRAATLIEAHAPRLAARIDRHGFAPLGTASTCCAARSRRPCGAAGRRSPDGRLALAIGDAWIVNDPITGQGANIGSHCAWVTADALASADRARRSVRRRLERRAVGVRRAR